MKKTVIAITVAVLALLGVASMAGANVIPNDARPGAQVLTRMECFTGTVQFTITGNGVSIPMGSAVAGSDGWAQLNFVMPNLAAGRYTMVGIGQDCDNPARVQQTNVGFNVLAVDPDYPKVGNFSALDRGTASPSELLTATAGYFVGDVDFVLVEANLTLGRAVARVDGVASIRFVAPIAPGDYTVRASGVDRFGLTSTSTTTFRVLTATVAPAAPPATRVIPAPTGADVVVATNAATPNAVVPVQVAGITETRNDAVAAVASTSNTRAQLVRTGSDAADLVRYALVAIAVGGALLIGTRRRSTARTR